MPFKNEKQRKYLYANKPKVAKEFAKKERAAKASTPKKPRKR